MSHDDEVLLDIVGAARRIIEFRQGLDYDSFVKDPMVQSAILYQFTILGEAVKRLSPAFRQGHPEIPWAKVAGMRDRVVHGYMHVDLMAVWQTATENVPALLGQLEPLVPRER
jgi:uncharacterized protein with HEPN domain